MVAPRELIDLVLRLFEGRTDLAVSDCFGFIPLIFPFNFCGCLHWLWQDTPCI